MRILGIDPGYERLGIAILEKGNNAKPFGKAQGKERVLFSECFKTKAELPFQERIALVGEKIKEVIKKYKPDILAIETLFMNTNQKTVMRVAEVRGVIIYECARGKLSIFEATPLQIKIATTGYGRSEKSQVMKMVKLLVDIEKNKTSDDELDAIAAALTGFAHHRA